MLKKASKRASESATVAAVIPCFNSEATLVRALDSVINQTRSVDQILLIDNGSQDGTLALAKSFQNRFADQIKILTFDQNKGASAARNLGWESADTDYLAFLDSDDSWHPLKIERQLGYMEGHPNAAISGHDYIHPEEKIHSAIPTQFETHLIRARSILVRNPTITPSIMLKRSLKLRFRESAARMEDQLLWFEITRANGPLHFLDLKLAKIYKPLVGHSGLSQNAWAMRKAELHNFKTLYFENQISILDFGVLSAFSLLKHALRAFSYRR